MARTRVRNASVILLLSVAASLGLGFLAGRAGAGVDAVTTGREGSPVQRVYLVRDGDTLWRIASQVAGSDEDPRPMVHDLIALNHIEGAVIVPGQRLRLP